MESLIKKNSAQARTVALSNFSLPTNRMTPAGGGMGAPNKKN
jgi:hypothetical protein